MTPGAGTAAAGCGEHGHRGPGRPRSPECDDAILRAALELLAENGFSGLSIDGVSARAGVGKATIYRRWESKAALVVDAIRVFSHERIRFVDTGSARDDLVSFMQTLIDALRTTSAGRVMAGLVAEFPRHPELAEAFRRGFVAPRRASLLAALQRGIERGELRPDVDCELVADAVVAFLHHRWMVTGLPLDDDLPERFVNVLFQGAAADR